MTDLDLFSRAIGYHHYLVHNNWSNVANPYYTQMITRAVWFDDHIILEKDDLPQIYRVARLVRRYLKS